MTGHSWIVVCLNFALIFACFLCVTDPKRLCRHKSVFLLKGVRVLPVKGRVFIFLTRHFSQWKSFYVILQRKNLHMEHSRYVKKNN